MVNIIIENVFGEVDISKYKIIFVIFEFLIINNSEKYYLMFGMDK